MKTKIQHAKTQIEFFRQSCQKCHPSMKSFYQEKYDKWKLHLQELLKAK
jgi:hypothetical protein